jgi:multidrug efflux pump subunit AcrA (membrane-fusion protein)
MKRRIVFLLIGGVVIAGAVVGTLYLRPWERAEEPETETRTAVVERGTLLVVVSASGSVEPATSVSLSFEAPGRVEEVAVEVGDMVRAGDTLARVDARQLELQVRQARSSMALAEAQLDQLNAGPRLAEVAASEANLRVAQAQLSAAEARRDQTASGVGRAQIAGAEAQLANALLQRKPVQDAHDRTVNGGGSDEAKEQARYDLFVATKTVEAAQAQLDDLLAGVSRNEIRASEAGVSSAAAQLDAAQAQLDLVRAGATSEQIADADAQVAQAKAALSLAESALEGVAVIAPFDAIVAQLDVRVGDLASPGVPRILLLDASEPHVTVSVDEIDVGKLAEGQSAIVVLDALPQEELVGTIGRIAPVATLKGGIVYYEVEINLAPSNAPVRIDMSATAMVTIEELVDVLQIPTWVVRVDRATGNTYVHRQEGDVVERVDIDLGQRHEGVALVLSGLSEGDVLVWVEDVLPFGLGGS